MYMIYSMLQQQYTVMLHSKDCTVIESGHSGQYRADETKIKEHNVQRTSLALEGGQKQESRSTEKTFRKRRMNYHREQRDRSSIRHIFSSG